MVWLYNGTFYLTDDGAENFEAYTVIQKGFENLKTFFLVRCVVHFSNLSFKSMDICKHGNVDAESFRLQ